MSNSRTPSDRSASHRARPSKRPAEMPRIRTQADLENHWRALMEPLGFARLQLWLHVLAPGGVPTDVIVHIEDLQSEPEDLFVRNLMSICERILEEGLADGSVAILLSRPGADRRTPSDVAWAGALTAAADLSGVPLRPIYLATDVDVRIISPDDLLAATA